CPQGTRQYMAPEQTRGEKTDPPGACDIWAIGVTLYELLAGARPFPDDGSSDLSQRICEQAPPPLPHTVPPELEAVVWKCLEKKPEDRYATAGAVADDLERWLAGKPSPKPLALTPPGSPAPPRHPRWLVPAALLALAGLIALPAALVPKRTPPPERPIPQRLRDGETVWIIGPKGRPLVPVLPGIPGNELTLDKDGFCLLAGRGPEFKEFISDPLPLPVVLEGDVALRQAQPKMGIGGFYIGRQTVVFDKGPVHAMW